MTTTTQALHIIEPTDPVRVDHPIVLVFGQPGACKTSLGFSAENSILLNFDTEAALARAVNRGRAINVLSLDAMRAVEENRDGIFDPFSTITIDTIGGLVDLMTAVIVDDVPKYGKNGGLTPQGWGVLKTRFTAFLTRVRLANKNILMLAHNKEDKNGDHTVMRPDIAGGSKDTVLRLADFVGYLYMSGKERVLDFSPTESWYGKNSAGWQPMRVPPAEKARDFMSKLFADARNALSRDAIASDVAAQQLIDWRADIETFVFASEFNRAIPNILALPEVMKKQVAKLLVARSRECKLTFDEAARCYVDPLPPPPPPPVARPLQGLFS